MNQVLSGMFCRPPLAIYYQSVVGSTLHFTNMRKKKADETRRKR
jgi:hypothetical protein